MAISLKLRHFDWTGIVLETDLPPNAKYLCLYLAGFMNKNQDIAWPSLTRIVTETGLSRSTVCKFLDLLEKQGWLIRQKGNSTKNTRYLISFPQFIQNQVQLGSPSDGLGSARDGLRSPCDGLGVVRETDPNSPYNHPTNKLGANTPKTKKFKAPTLEEVTSYCRERSNNIDPQSFLDFYTASNWMRGKTKIKDWKACVRTWERNAKPPSPNDDLAGAI